MSLYLTELKVKTALELLLDVQLGLFESSCSKADRAEIDRNLERVRGILLEIIDRPKEQSNG